MGCCRRSIQNASPGWKATQRKYVQKAAVNVAAGRPAMTGMVKSPCHVAESAGEFLSLSIRQGQIMLHLPDGKVVEARSTLAKCSQPKAVAALQVINAAYVHVKSIASQTQGQRFTLSFLRSWSKK